MANKFQFKRTTISGRTPNTTNSANTSFIDAGELAINLVDGILYSSNGTASFQVGANLSSLNVGGNVVITGNLTINGTSTTVTSRNLSVADNMIFLNEPIPATITGAVGNGTVVIYTSLNGYAIGEDVRITGMNPASFDITNADITAANSTTFSIASAVTDSFVSGGTAYARADVNPDLGFAGEYNDGTYRHAGFFRDATDSRFKVFDQLVPEPSGPFVDTANNTFRIADFQANGVFAANGEYTTTVKVGSNVVINTTALFIGNSTVNVVLTSSTLDLGTILDANSTSIRLASNTFFANSTVVKINVNDTLTFNDSTTQNTAFRVYDSAGTRIA